MLKKPKAVRLPLWFCACALFWSVVCPPSFAADAPAIASAVDSSPAASSASAQYKLEEYFLLALSTSEGVAVLRSPDRKLTTLRVGTVLVPARARLVQVLVDRLRFETVDDKGVRQTAWMIRSANPEQLPQLQRVDSSPPSVAGVAPKGSATVQPLSVPAATKK